MANPRLRSAQFVPAHARPDDYTVLLAALIVFALWPLLQNLRPQRPPQRPDPNTPAPQMQPLKLRPKRTMLYAALREPQPEAKQWGGSRTLPPKQLRASSRDLGYIDNARWHPGLREHREAA